MNLAHEGTQREHEGFRQDEQDFSGLAKSTAHLVNTEANSVNPVLVFFVSSFVRLRWRKKVWLKLWLTITG